MNRANQAKTIPFFGTKREFSTYRNELIAVIVDIMETGQSLQGPAVDVFEKNVAQLSNRAFAVAVNSCTDALYFALRAVGIGPGDEVLVTDFSFVASASCIARLGAKPIFVDVDKTYQMDLDKAELHLSPKTKALLFVHLYGQMGDPKQIEDFAQKHGLALIEDAAQAIGASYHGQPAGSLGAVSCISFDPTKPISAPGSGGVILTDKACVAECVRRLRYHGKNQEGYFEQIGYNSQMPTLTAAVLDFKLQKNKEWLRQRRKIAKYYVEELHDTELTLPQEIDDVVHIYHKFVIQSPRRDELKAWLKDHGIQTKIHYQKPLHQQPCFSSEEYMDKDYPNALSFSRSVLSLPIHPFLKDGEVERIVETIKNF